MPEPQLTRSAPYFPVADVERTAAHYERVLGFRREYSAGSPPEFAIVTRDAARCMKLDRDLGTLEPGKWADFVVLDADPLADISNVKRIASVWIAGNQVKR